MQTQAKTRGMKRHARTLPLDTPSLHASSHTSSFNDTLAQYSTTHSSQYSSTHSLIVVVFAPAWHEARHSDHHREPSSPVDHAWQHDQHYAGHHQNHHQNHHHCHAPGYGSAAWGSPLKKAAHDGQTRRQHHHPRTTLHLRRDGRCDGTVEVWWDFAAGSLSTVVRVLAKLVPWVPLRAR